MTSKEALPLLRILSKTIISQSNYRRKERKRRGEEEERGSSKEAEVERPLKSASGSCTTQKERQTDRQTNDELSQPRTSFQLAQALTSAHHCKGNCFRWLSSNNESPPPPSLLIVCCQRWAPIFGPLPLIHPSIHSFIPPFIHSSIGTASTARGTVRG